MPAIAEKPKPGRRRSSAVDGARDTPRRPTALQERFWAVERGAWVVFALMILAAVLGLTGAGGVFSRASMSLPGGTVDYPRVARWQASDHISVSFTPGAAERQVTLSPDLLDKVDVDHVVPPPKATRSGPAGSVYSFDVDAAKGGEVDFNLRVEHPGWTAFRIGLDGDSADGALLVLP